MRLVPRRHSDRNFILDWLKHAKLAASNHVTISSNVPASDHVRPLSSRGSSGSHTGRSPGAHIIYKKQKVFSNILYRQDMTSTPLSRAQIMFLLIHDLPSLAHLHLSRSTHSQINNTRNSRLPSPVLYHPRSPGTGRREGWHSSAWQSLCSSVSLQELQQARRLPNSRRIPRF